MMLGDPGIFGTSNPAAYTTRRQFTFANGMDVTSGIIANTVAVTHASVPATEIWTCYAAWTTITFGLFLFSGTVNNGSVAAGASPVTPIGGITATLTGLAA